MAYSRDTYRRVREQYEEKRKLAIDEADARKVEIYAKIPEVQKIDAYLSGTGAAIMECIMKKTNVREGIAALQYENEQLQKKRAELLAAAGYPADYTSPRFSCPVCADTGFDGLKMCRCMKKAMTLAGIEDSGLSKLCETQSFENFDLGFYASDQQALARMKGIYRALYDYAENFSDKEHPNLLLVGGTGLGKTHLTTSMAVKIIDKGFDVLYESAPDLFGILESQRFARESEKRVDTDHYFTCDLLIIDDLGAEATTGFTVSCLYNLINTRLISGKATIINTNLGFNEVSKRYTDRIASRLLGEYSIHQFLGSDVRMQKRMR